MPRTVEGSFLERYLSTVVSSAFTLSRKRVQDPSKLGKPFVLRRRRPGAAPQVVQVKLRLEHVADQNVEARLDVVDDPQRVSPVGGGRVGEPQPFLELADQVRQRLVLGARVPRAQGRVAAVLPLGQQSLGRLVHHGAEREDVRDRNVWGGVQA